MVLHQIQVSLSLLELNLQHQAQLNLNLNNPVNHFKEEESDWEEDLHHPDLVQFNLMAPLVQQPQINHKY
jgi:hypothetical protein